MHAVGWWGCHGSCGADAEDYTSYVNGMPDPTDSDFDPSFCGVPGSRKHGSSGATPVAQQGSITHAIALVSSLLGLVLCA